MDREQSVQHFLDLLKKSRRGNFKIYIGMIAGVGKSYRMLSDAHQLLESGIDVKIGYIETHGRVETEALVEGLPIIPRRKIFYKGKEIEEMDLQSILSIHPEVVIVDELAHTNVEGSKNEKRWQDVMDILDAGISVITAVNIQHIEGLNEMVQDVVGIEVKSHGWQPDIIPSFLYCMYKPQEKVPTGFRWQVKGICLTISSWQRNLEEKSFKCNPHI